ncbi:MAG: hypothetical protein IJT60_06915 [Clostridia bacterium]|nr:hypothetical protein [Clostridia bacterium]
MNDQAAKKYCIISHTHWDREWYIPLENFRMRLVDLIDHLLDILKKDKEYRFHLDAQTIVLEDYLEIRPEREKELKKHIKSGRILVGPWYVQNDFHLTSGEATIRNLIIGTKIAEDFGKCTQIGYAADQFGLISQLPQILSRYGIDNCIFGRGFDRGDDKHERTTEFYWATEDGSHVLCEHMRFWYNNAQRFSPDPEGALALARGRGEMCSKCCSTSNYLLMNGVDHLEAQEDLSAILKKVRPLLAPDEEIFQDTMPEFLDRVKAELKANGTELKTFMGEFRDNGADNVLTGTLASRVYLKQWNAKLQSLLEKKFEPLYAFTSMCGIQEFPKDYDTYMWKVLIQNHPHDSICGCSVDAVHEHMVDRFKRVNENVQDLIKRGNESLLNHINRVGLKKNQYLVIIMNQTQLGTASPVRAVVEIPVDEDTGNFTLQDQSGSKVPFIVLNIEKDLDKRVLSPINLPGGKKINAYTILVDPGYLQPFSHRVLVLTPQSRGKLKVAHPYRPDQTKLENEYLKVEINANGTLNITEKASGRTYEQLLMLEDNVDTGNAYNYFENDGSEIFTSRDVKAKITVTLDHEFIQQRAISYAMPLVRNGVKCKLPVKILVTLKKGSRYVDIRMELDNQIRRHRVRALFPTGLHSETNYAGQPFDILVRNKVSQFRNDKTHPNTDFVGVENGDSGLALFQVGLYEYEQMTDEKDSLALTLLRAVGRITGGFEQEATMDQGWVTPGGHCLGIQQYHLAIYPYSGDHVKASVAAMAQQFISRPYGCVQSVDPNKFVGGRPFVQGPGMPDIFYRPIPNAKITLPHEMQYLRVTQSVPNAMILSACKGSEKGGSFIYRFYNSTSENVDFQVAFPMPIRSAAKVTLGERFLEGLTPESGGNKLSFKAAPKEIVTFEVAF